MPILPPIEGFDVNNGKNAELLFFSTTEKSREKQRIGI
jgi:hypothetical protein